MYISNQYSLKQQTHWPSLCNWQGPNYTPVTSSGWVNTTGGDTERFFYSSPIREQPGPAVPGESHCQICRFLSTGHKPYVLGQCQTLYLIFRHWTVAFVPIAITIIMNEIWYKMVVEFFYLLDTKRIHYSVIIVNRKEINSLLNGIAI